MTSERYDYKGVVHMHSKYSDGNDTIEQIAAAANEAVLDFVVMSDHDTLKPLDDGHEKWHESTLFIIGTEITPPKNHYLTFGSGKFEGLEGLRAKNPQEVIDAVNGNGWAGFIAHPDYKGSQKLDVDNHSWEAWDVNGFTGISIWHFVSNWLGEVEKIESPDISLHDNFEKVVKAPLTEAIERWDQFLSKGRVTGIAEIDNHSKVKKYNDKEIVIFPLNRVLKTLTNHVLLEEPLSKDVQTAKAQIVNAFKAGSLYICNEALGEAEDFYFMVEDGGVFAHPGDEFMLKGNAELVVSLPEEARIRIIHNGKVHKEVNSFEFVEPVHDKGYYRVEVYKGDHCWVLTNPVYVK